MNKAPCKTDKSKRKGVCFGGKVLTDKKSAQFIFRFIFNPTHHSFPFCLDFLADRSALVGKRCGGKLGWSDLSHSLPKTPYKYYHTPTKAVVRANRDQKITKKNVQTIMTSTRSSDYVAIGGGGDGVGGGSQSSRLLVRGPPPRGKEEEDDDSTPDAFDVDDGNGGQVDEVNGECEGNGNSNGPVDNNNNDDYDIDNNNNDNNGGGQDRSANMGQLWRSMRRWRERRRQGRRLSV